MNMTVSDLCVRALRIAGRGDKPTADDLNQAIVSLNGMTSAWRSRGVDLFNLYDQQIILPVADTVLVSGATYVCIREHYSTIEDNPGVGANWQNYWAVTTNVTATIAWAEGTTYQTPNKLMPMGSSPELAEVVNTRIVRLGEVTPVIPIGRATFMNLDPAILGIPTVLYQVLGNALELRLHPTPDYEDLVFLFTGVMVPPDQIIGGEAWFPPPWLQALQYGLASELSYHFVLPPERVAMLNQKAEREFLLAKGYPKKEAETCGIKSLY